MCVQLITLCHDRPANPRPAPPNTSHFWELGLRSVAFRLNATLLLSRVPCFKAPRGGSCLPGASSSKVMDFLPPKEFGRSIGPHRGTRWMLGFSCRDQFLCSAFVQLTFRETPRAVETCLQALELKFYHARLLLAQYPKNWPISSVPARPTNDLNCVT
jgi:hypothetical protein